MREIYNLDLCEDTIKCMLDMAPSITNLSDNNKTKQELITAARISNDPIGRNYKNILVECMNKLY